MGLADDIQTLEARYEVGQDVGNDLAEAYAEMICRKASKKLIRAWFQALKELMEELGRYGELIEAAGGVDPAGIGIWDIQQAVESWSQEEGK